MHDAKPAAPWWSGIFDRHRPAPAVLRIDIETDDVQMHSGAPWHGFSDFVALIDGLRQPLGDLAGHPFQVHWMVRVDPIVAHHYGDAGFALEQYRGLFERIERQGDSIGLHVHSHRWDDTRQVLYSDYRDSAWIRHCIESSVERFARHFGKPPECASMGGYFMSNEVLADFEAAGIRVDLTAEPGLGALRRDHSMGAYAIGSSADFRASPRRPYYPSRLDFTTPAEHAAGATRVLMVPLTSFDYQSARQAPVRRLARRILRRASRPMPLSPWKPWHSPREYWDLVGKAVDEGPGHYFAAAIRTDGAGSPVQPRVQQILEYLPRHPVARRLHFTAPSDSALRAIALNDRIF